MRIALSKAGFFVYTCIIKGHGTKDLISPYQKWLKEVNQQFNRFQMKYDEIVIIGFSMGGVLASYLFQSPNYRIKGTVLISAAFNHIYFYDITKKSLKELKRNLQREKKKTHRMESIYGVKELKKLTDLAKKENWLKNINRPTFVIQGYSDGVLKDDNVNYIFNHLRCQKRMKLYSGYHYILENQEIYKDIIRFIEEVYRY